MGRRASAEGPREATQPACSVPRCPANAAEGATICRHHAHLLRHRLAVVPELLAELRVAVSRQAVMEQHSGRAAETPLPWADRPALADARLRAVLGLLARRTAERHTDERDPLGPALAAGAAEVSRWVTRNLHTTGALDEVGRAVDELDTCVSRAWQVIDKPMFKARFYVGPCPNDQGEGDAYPGRPCPGEAWAHVPSDEDEPGWIRCTADRRHRWDTTQWKRLAKRIQARAAQRLERE